jgi:hypothetical protein
MRCASAWARAGGFCAAGLPRLPARFLDLAVALESDLVDGGVLDHRDEDAGGIPLDAHVCEQAGGEQGLDGLVDLARIVGIAGVELEVGANRLRLDAPVAGHANLADRGRLRFSGSGGHQHRLDEHQREQRGYRDQD